MRRQNRLEVQRDKQDRIRLGLLPPDMPRVTKSNFMRILGQEAVLAPSMIESLVEKQVEARKQAHQDKLDSQKLTDEQRKEKKRLKLKEDTALLCNVAVFKIRQLTHAQHKFKVNQNAQQYNLTGVGIVYHDMSVVIVEGGPKGINAYKKLMLKRIDWAISNKDVFADVNECLLVWEGQVQTRNFYQFRLKTFPTEAQIKEYLEKMNSVHYWNTAKNYVVESI